MSRCASLIFRTGTILLSWIVLLVVEHFVAAIVFRRYLAAAWEMALVRRQLAPVGLGLLLPPAVVLALVGMSLARASDRRLQAVAGAAAVLFAATVGWGVTFGRHFRLLPLRIAFVGALAGLGLLAARKLAPLVRRAWGERPTALGVGGLVGGLLFWCADFWILPRLYPAFHQGAFAVALLLTALSSVGWTVVFGERGAKVVSFVALAGSVFGLLWFRSAAHTLAAADNLRLILVDRAPLFGRTFRALDLLLPQAETGALSQGDAAPPPGEIGRELHWENLDLLLVSIDALRADHVGAYGYQRHTTPNIDALAREGTLFDAAYCPTPHTSYSVTSMMAGKPMRPLMALGLGDDSELLPAAVRRYGYKTAAFYPPAVFFIDPDRFTSFQERRLDFEYAKVEFASPAVRVEQLDSFLRATPSSQRVFVWVHLFEPHEPYVSHPEHAFGDRPIDAYDSEIAVADEGVGKLVRTFRARRTNSVVLVTADHGEEFGEHGGRYHGTTVYEEQVHVPLVVVGPGVAHGRVQSAVQTIDIYPTLLSALGVPRPARLAGRDLGPLLAGKANDEGLAFSESAGFSLLARGRHRLICSKDVLGCSLFDVQTDPNEAHSLAQDHPARLSELRKMRRDLYDDVGRYERGSHRPAALQRALAGDAEAVDEVASLLEDANGAVRLESAQVLFRAASRRFRCDNCSPGAVLASLERALAHEERADIRGWLAVTRTRWLIPRGPNPTTRPITKDDLGRVRGWLVQGDAGGEPALRRRAALVLAEAGDASGEAVLVDWWKAEAPPSHLLSEDEWTDLLDAFEAIHARTAVPALAASFERSESLPAVRGKIALALGSIGDVRARNVLFASFSAERYLSARGPEAEALVRLGVRRDLGPPLARFAGMPEPFPGILEIADRAGLLSPEQGGYASRGRNEQESSPPSPEVDPFPEEGVVLHPSGPGPYRLLVELRKGDPQKSGDLELRLDGAILANSRKDDSPGANPSVFDVPKISRGLVQGERAIRRLWLVSAQPEFPPPPPVRWNGDAGEDTSEGVLDRAADGGVPPAR